MHGMHSQILKPVCIRIQETIIELLFRREMRYFHVLGSDVLEAGRCRHDHDCQNKVYTEYDAVAD